MDISSDTWAAVKLWAEEELESSRTNLESLNVDNDLSMQLRGEISILKQLLNLPVSSRKE